ncbi:uncharacterized protein AC631_04865 [Debaryomyces fabryi]|uniref:triacylglycerol lipase n=1 Tax=Debaryomyces fabryi TaxID=58627 RepID=A0A0V1PT98_9ASCO|nr:uncharacterized protein AC631_04865 [Debaryomyces fabryi]KRZ99378.1 hypothetical protein AC631_04865 [Debaryomyces fabryi]CUM45921.1 unnamed protein product [Debaryomyces fabryi]
MKFKQFMKLSFIIWLQILWYLNLVLGSSQIYLADGSPVPEPIDHEIYSNLFTYAHLIDISYCISQGKKISKPFNCDLNCSNRFPNMTLVHQWCFADSVCGYISTTNRNIFFNNDTDIEDNPRKSIIISIRGTRSIFDTYTDLKAKMVKYSQMGTSLPRCGNDCKVHQGFYEYFQFTLNSIHEYLENELNQNEDYELIFLGHSMGGSISLLLALHYLDLGYDRLTLVTMGQPLVGNENFVHWVDNVTGSSVKPHHNSFKRKYLRIIHRNDIITTIPRSKNFFETYYQFDNQIYLNCSSGNVPTPDQVIDCANGNNLHCIKGDFINNINRNYYEIHNTYFRKLGLCGIKI